MKIVTICGSFKFQKEMLEIGEKLSLEGYCVLHRYVGESTKNEIEYAKKLNKEIMYYDE